jgi:two-component system cell cycle sensor histidine kinase/response regulator CckA
MVARPALSPQIRKASNCIAMGRSPMIIVVDDEPDILQYIREILRHVNYEVITATSGDQAWTLFEEHQPEIDMVLTDVVMSGSIDGLELAAKIHQVDPSLPVLFVTGALPEGDARAVGIVEKELLVRKPFSPKQLIDLVEARIRRF